jgi:predicted RND superfamily exporter protein
LSNPQAIAALNKLIEALEEHDDVKEVYSTQDPRFGAGCVSNGKDVSRSVSSLLNFRPSMSPLTSDSFSGRQLGKLAWAVVHRRGWFVYPQVVLFVLSILYTVKFLEFDTKRSSLVGANMRYHQNYLNFKKDFQAQNDLVVVVEGA